VRCGRCAQAHAPAGRCNAAIVGPPPAARCATRAKLGRSRWSSTAAAAAQKLACEARQPPPQLQTHDDSPRCRRVQACRSSWQQCTCGRGRGSNCSCARVNGSVARSAQLHRQHVARTHVNINTCSTGLGWGHAHGCDHLVKPAVGNRCVCLVTHSQAPCSSCDIPSSRQTHATGLDCKKFTFGCQLGVSPRAHAAIGL
jgi:hypothetical protein